MPFKYDEDGRLVTREPEGGGEPLPVYETKDGKEILYDPNVSNSRLKEARDNARALNEQVEAMRDKLASFEGIKDPQAVLQELEDLKKKASAKPAPRKGEGEEGRGEEAEHLAEQINQLEQVRESLERKVESLEKDLEKAFGKIDEGEQNVRQLGVSAAFKSSSWFNPWIDEEGNRRPPRTTLEADVAEAKFGRHFTVTGKNGDLKVVATYTPGGKDIIYSDEKPEQPAQFDEAVAALLQRWPRRNHYLPHEGPGGMGARESGGGGGGATSVSRATFDKWGPRERADFIKKGGKVTEATR